MKKWKCLVCGYIHTGDEPPETCPVCGAPKEKFVEVVDEGAPAAKPVAAAEAPAAAPPSALRRAMDLLTRLHGHPISVHIPNGLLPVAILFLLVSAVFGTEALAVAALCNLGVVALAMPAVLFTGWVDWQNRFDGAITHVFKVKIACGILVTVLAWVAFIWLWVAPEVLDAGHPARLVFLAINLILLGAAGTAGWYGGKLVFNE